MNGYEYAKFVSRVCRELEAEIGVTPVLGCVHRNWNVLKGWHVVLCHPEDQDKTDETHFKHPYRDI